MLVQSTALCSITKGGGEEDDDDFIASFFFILPSLPTPFFVAWALLLVVSPFLFFIGDRPRSRPFGREWREREKEEWGAHSEKMGGGREGVGEPGKEDRVFLSFFFLDCITSAEEGDGGSRRIIPLRFIPPKLVPICLEEKEEGEGGSQLGRPPLPS